MNALALGTQIFAPYKHLEFGPDGFGVSHYFAFVFVRMGLEFGPDGFGVSHYFAFVFVRMGLEFRAVQFRIISFISKHDPEGTPPSPALSSPCQPGRSRNALWPAQNPCRQLLPSVGRL